MVEFVEFIKWHLSRYKIKNSLHNSSCISTKSYIGNSLCISIQETPLICKDFFRHPAFGVVGGCRCVPLGIAYSRAACRTGCYRAQRVNGTVTPSPRDGVTVFASYVADFRQYITPSRFRPAARPCVPGPPAAPGAGRSGGSRCPPPSPSSGAPAASASPGRWWGPRSRFRYTPPGGP